MLAAKALPAFSQQQQLFWEAAVVVTQTEMQPKFQAFHSRFQQKMQGEPSRLGF